MLRPGGKRRKNEAGSENDEPDPPHGHLGWEGCRGVEPKGTLRTSTVPQTPWC